MGYGDLVSDDTWGSVTTLTYDLQVPSALNSDSDYISEYSFLQSTPAFENLQEGQKSLVHLFLGNSTEYNNFFSDVTFISFEENIDPNTVGDILIGQAFVTKTHTAVTRPPGDDNDADGDVWISKDPTKISQTQGALNPGQTGYYAILHELIHAVAGLKDAGKVYTSSSDKYQDSQQYTLMSYNPLGWTFLSDGPNKSHYASSVNSLYYDSNINNKNPLFAYGLQLYDIKAIQDVFGVAASHATGDTQYSLGNGLGRDGDAHKAFIYTIWDTGGDNDVINAYAFTGSGARIDLTPGSFSSIGENGHGQIGYDYEGGKIHINNVAIAYGVTIENAVGTDNYDTLIGNDADNILIGNKGHDTFYGSIGDDIIHGGFVRSEISSVRPGWDSSGYYSTLVDLPHFDGNYFGEIDGFDTLDYSNLDAISGSNVSVNTRTGIVDKGTNGTDHFFSIEYFIGTSSGNVFLGNQARLDNEGGISGNGYEGRGGNDSYKFDLELDTGVASIYEHANEGASDSVEVVGNNTIKYDYAEGVGNVYGYTHYSVTSLTSGDISYQNVRFDTDYYDENGLYWTSKESFEVAIAQYSGAEAGIEHFTVDGKEIALTPAAMAANNLGGGAIDGSVLYGSSYGDTYSTSSLADYVFASGGNDTVNSGDGNDVVSGGDGNDTLDGGNGSDTLSYSDAGLGIAVNIATTTSQNTVGAGYDTITNFENIIGSEYNDTITGNSGSNIIDGRGGNDILNGGSGVDTLSYASAASGITINLATATAQVTGGAGTDTISGFENVIGSAFNDTLTGTTGTNTIEGGAGDDYMDAVSGTDTLSYEHATGGITVSLSLTTAQVTGGAGTDTVLHFDNIIGSAYDDTLTGTGSTNVIDGGGGNDFIRGGVGNDTMTGGAGIDTLSYTDGTSAVTINLATTTAQVTGGSGTDTISGFENVIGSAYADILTGDGNANTIDGGAGNDTLDGAAGIDTLTYATATSGITINLATTTAQVTGGSGTDTISNFENVIGSAFNNTITGTSGDNIVEGGKGNDILVGGAGNDTLSYASATGSVTVSLAITTAQYTNVAGGTDTISGFENLTGGDYNDFLLGDSGNNIIMGGKGADGISGSAGNDILDGGESNYDVVYYLDATSGITVDLTVTTAQNTGGGGIDTLTNFEGVTTSDYADVIRANDAGDWITTNGGDDQITQGAGNDSINGGNGFDTILYYTATSGVAVDLSLTSQQDTGGAGLDIVQNFEAITGSIYNDTLTGTSGDNQLNGNWGDDVLFGMDGNDLFFWSLGSDYMDGGNGSDAVSYFYATGGVTVNLGAESALHDGTSEDQLVSIETVYGSAYNDAFTGGASDDTFYGNDGADVFFWSAGSDKFYGGNGNDSVSYFYADTGVVASLATNTVVHGASTDTLDSIEIIYGSINADTITGNSANNDLYGNDGNDIINGGGGGDYMDGGAGSDTVSYAGYGSAVTVNLTLGVQNTYGAIYDNILNFENILGSAYNDTLTGTLGNNILEGGAGNDTMNGGAGIDTLSYASATAAITMNLSTTTAQTTGGAGTDTISNFENIFGSAYNDTLTGTSGNNILEGGAGNDTLNGGSGTDTVSYEHATAGVTLNLATTTAQNTTGAGTDTLSGLESILGSAYNDTLTGTTSNNIIEGGAGDDYMDAVSGTDTLSYEHATGGITINLSTTTAQNTVGAGTDTIINFENISGSAYNDTLTGDANANTIDGRVGDDILDGAGGTDTVSYSTATAAVTVNLATATAQNTVGAGTDTITNFENLTGSAYNDTLTGNTGNNVIEGLAGNDIMDGSSGTDTVSYASSTAAVTVNLATTTAQNTVGAGTDTITNFENLTGSAYNDTLTGTSGSNTIEGGLGNDTIDGAGGTDTLTYGTATAGITVSLALTTAQITGGAGTDTISNFENLKGSSYNDVLSGTSGVNNIDGGNGNDLIYADLGNDTVSGGGNTDTLSFENILAAITVNFATTTAQNTGGAGTDTISNFENVIGSAYDDTITGTTGNNTLEGGLGNDYMDAVSGTDTLSYEHATSAITVNIATTTAQNTFGAGTDTVLNFDIIIGSAYNDTLTGNTGNNTIIGGAGNDYIDGASGTDTVSYSTATAAVTVNLATTTAQNTIGAGTDTLHNMEYLTGSNYNDTLTGNSSGNTIDGGAGNDTLDGAAGTDTATYFYASSAVTVNLATTTAQNTGGAGIDTLANFENLTGSAYNDTLIGNSGNNTFKGEAGADTITGAAGADSFYFDTATLGTVDTITDFTTSQGDKLDISNILVGYTSGVSAIDDFISFTTSGANTIVSVDRDGTGSAYTSAAVATLSSVVGLDADTFLANGNLIAA